MSPVCFPPVPVVRDSTSDPSSFWPGSRSGTPFCDTACTTGADAATRPAQRHPEPPTHLGSPGSGQRPPPCARATDTMGGHTGTADGHAATWSRNPVPPTCHAAAQPHAGAAHNARRPGSAQGTRGSSTGGGGCGAWGDHSKSGDCGDGYASVVHLPSPADQPPEVAQGLDGRGLSCERSSPVLS